MNNQQSKIFALPLYRNIYFYLLVWFIINLLQASFTELFHDEAYYWMYSQQLDWGYFDHPPLIALLVRLGTALFPGELGARFFMVVMSTGTLFLIYKLIPSEKRKAELYFLLIASIILVHSHVGGFIVVPDIPLIFFTALFFYLYKKYLEKDTLWMAILIGVCISMMFYSKYHGLLIVIFTLASDIKILKRKSIWIAVPVIAVLMLPHLFWQIENNFPTFKYHLSGRSRAFEINDLWNYLYSQVLIAGPLTAILLIYHALVKQPANQFQRTLKFNLIGFWSFFFLTSFRGHVEPHWTSPAFIALIILSYLHIQAAEKAKKWLFYLGIPSIVVFLLFRLLIIVNFFPMKVTQRVHGWDNWAETIAKKSNGLPVIFKDKYQYPSKYTFYTGNFAHTLNSVFYRKNQYDLWGYGDSIQGKTVWYMRVPKEVAKDSITNPAGKTYYCDSISNFRTYYKVKIDILMPEGQKLWPDSLVGVPIQLINTTDKAVDFYANKKFPSRIYYYFAHNMSEENQLPVLNWYDKLPALAPNDTADFMATIRTPMKKGKYKFLLGIRNNYLPAMPNSDFHEIYVKKTKVLEKPDEMKMENIQN